MIDFMPSEWIQATFPPQPDHPNLEQETVMFGYSIDGFYCSRTTPHTTPMTWETWQELKAKLVPWLRQNADSLKMRLARDDLLRSD